MTRVATAPALLIWARDRAGVALADLARRFPKFAAWEAGDAQPTLKQLENFARAVLVPIGYLFLATPPHEELPIPDFRTVQGRGVRRPSPDLLGMLYACQERQGWYRDFATVNRLPEADFVGSASLDDAPAAVATRMAKALGFDLAARAACRTWEEALRMFISQAEAIGVLVMVSGVVLSNTRRTLGPKEFRGFALADQRAPLVFINGADSRSAQMFTLAHELAHLWLGASAVSDASAAPLAGHRCEEVWCNAVAAELLVPLDALAAERRRGEALPVALQRLARQFKVSTLVILRRILDAGWLDRARFDTAWQAEIERLQDMGRAAAGSGDFYRTTLSRVSSRFARARRKHAGGSDAVPRRLPDARRRADRDLQQHRARGQGAWMTRYLLDANVFIQAKNLHYGFRKPSSSAARHKAATRRRNNAQNKGPAIGLWHKARFVAILRTRRCSLWITPSGTRSRTFALSSARWAQ